MRRKATRTIPAQQVEEEVEVTCDLCKACVGKPNDRGENEWQPSMYDTLTTTVAIDEGTRYPEGSRGTVRAVDICPDCFTTKLIPWLQSQGATVREADYEF